MAVDPRPVPPALQSVTPTFARAGNATRDEVAAGVRSQSIAAHHVVDAADLEPIITAAHVAVRELPALAARLQAAVLDDRRPIWQRLGTLAGLIYGVAAFDAIPDMLGGYGFLDNWLVLSSTRWTYVEPPDPAQVTALAEQSKAIWVALPPVAAQQVGQLVMRMEQEAMALRTLPEAQTGALFAQILGAPAPVQFALPQVAAPAGGGGRHPLEGWSTNAAGAIWGSGDGRAMYVGFQGGGGVGMVNGKIVGGP